MIPSQGISQKNFKKALLLVLLVGWVISGIYILLLCVGSVWVSLLHAKEAGFWIPLSLGSLLFFLAFWVFYRGLRFLVSHLMRKEALSV